MQCSFIVFINYEKVDEVSLMSQKLLQSQDEYSSMIESK